MATAATTPDRLVLADLVPGSLARDAALIVGGAGLTGLAAQVSIHTPLTPVPFTLQTFAVLLTGAVLGPVRGALSMLLYLVAGVVGVPWFASHAHGWGGASFGYIIGFVVAAGVVGELSRRGNDRQVLSTIGLMALGSAIVYVFGATWLAADLHVGAQKAVDLGVTPFLVTDALKLAAAGLVLPAAWRLVRRFR
ncbi:MAG TPA: biotin transporter BioY [Jatrophihabitantaceae bacterium]|jgi:biotin transport system substrate-specific component|nr:biotin transporter BioY [Jatrophihabitantaceae bacterium]